MTAPLRIERARPEDLDPVLDLLARQRLPADGLRDHLATTPVARQGDEIVGSAALEVYPDGALLRSVAVAAALQGRGLGRELTTAALALARERGIRAIYLLTTTAAAYFPRLGFESIARDAVPATVRTSVEFTSACPSSATAMRRTL